MLLKTIEYYRTQLQAAEQRIADLEQGIASWEKRAGELYDETVKLREQLANCIKGREHARDQ